MLTLKNEKSTISMKKQTKKQDKSPNGAFRSVAFSFSLQMPIPLQVTQHNTSSGANPRRAVHETLNARSGA